MREEKRFKEYEDRIDQLTGEVAQIREENRKLKSENELLHDTAWKLVLEVRTLRGEKEHECDL